MILLLVLAAVFAAWQQPRRTIIDAEFKDAQLGYVLEHIAQMHGLEPVCEKSTSRVTVSIKNTELARVMQQILNQQPNGFQWALHNGKLICGSPAFVSDWTSPDCTKPAFIPEDAITREYQLHFAPAPRVTDFLAGQFDRVELTVTGDYSFVALGAVRDLDLISDDLPKLDRAVPTRPRDDSPGSPER